MALTFRILVMLCRRPFSTLSVIWLLIGLLIGTTSISATSIGTTSISATSIGTTSRFEPLEGKSEAV
ncbi:hypothetical protein GCM10007877_08830 [Marinibactrum halimedae]|uniref:Uncharacterized protein n=1 Tax=Marinibactrum halimedae TaxID=1444977 RepID=A0AA37T1D5_9GAMM|nr:hypothetical protein GCM10007877_08830 [Marinibactrum halimedae]